MVIRIKTRNGRGGGHLNISPEFDWPYNERVTNKENRLVGTKQIHTTL